MNTIEDEDNNDLLVEDVPVITDNQTQPIKKPKKPRSEKQLAAFERARLGRLVKLAEKKAAKELEASEMKIEVVKPSVKKVIEVVEEVIEDDQDELEGVEGEEVEVEPEVEIIYKKRTKTLIKKKTIKKKPIKKIIYYDTSDSESDADDIQVPYSVQLKPPHHNSMHFC